MTENFRRSARKFCSIAGTFRNVLFPSRTMKIFITLQSSFKLENCIWMIIKQMNFNFKNEWFSMQLIEAWILSDIKKFLHFIFILCKALLLILCCENIFIGFANGKIIGKENAKCKRIQGHRYLKNKSH
jgi:hypothetical protein